MFYLLLLFSGPLVCGFPAVHRRLALGDGAKQPPHRLTRRGIQRCILSYCTGTPTTFCTFEYRRLRLGDDRDESADV